jgi:hypothetical protein
LHPSSRSAWLVPRTQFARNFALPNASAGVARFGYFLFGAGVFGWLLDWTPASRPHFTVHLVYGVMALIGLIAICVAKQLENLEWRLDVLEQKQGD